MSLCAAPQLRVSRIAAQEQVTPLESVGAARAENVATNQTPFAECDPLRRSPEDSAAWRFSSSGTAA
jgi:hypothetical protein